MPTFCQRLDSFIAPIFRSRSRSTSSSSSPSTPTSSSSTPTSSSSTPPPTSPFSFLSFFTRPPLDKSTIIGPMSPDYASIPNQQSRVTHQHYSQPTDQHHIPLANHAPHTPTTLEDIWFQCQREHDRRRAKLERERRSRREQGQRYELEVTRREGERRGREIVDRPRQLRREVRRIKRDGQFSW